MGDGKKTTNDATTGNAQSETVKGRSDREAGGPTRSAAERRSDQRPSAGLPRRRSSATASTTSDGEQRGLEAAVYSLRVGVLMSVRYHDRRRSWLTGWHNVTLVATVLFAGGVAARLETVTGLAWLGWVLSTLTGVTVALNIVFRFAERAAEHHVLANRFRELQSKLVSSATREEYDQLARDRIAIEAEEPPGPKRLLSVLCQYESVRATREDLSDDVTEMMSKIKWWRRALAPAWSQVGFVTRELRGLRMNPA